MHTAKQEIKNDDELSEMKLAGKTVDVANSISSELSLEMEFLSLVEKLLELGSIAVAFSGGVDSAFLAYMGRQVLGYDFSLAVTSISDSFGSTEAQHCKQLAHSWDMRIEFVHSREMDNPNYIANDTDRCYWCKVELMEAIGPILAGSTTKVVLGVNVDDLGDHRPGQKAALEAGALFPLVDAGYTKEMIRRHSKVLGLSTWDRPQAACLSSRIPYGTQVSVSILTKLDRAERALKDLGFRQLRLRHYDVTARLEIPLDDFYAVMEKRKEIVAAIKDAGYKYVTLDLEGFRSGNLNS